MKKPRRSVDRRGFLHSVCLCFRDGPPAVDQMAGIKSVKEVAAGVDPEGPAVQIVQGSHRDGMVLTHNEDITAGAVNQPDQEGRNRLQRVGGALFDMGGGKDVVELLAGKGGGDGIVPGALLPGDLCVRAVPDGDGGTDLHQGPLPVGVEQKAPQGQAQDHKNRDNGDSLFGLHQKVPFLCLGQITGWP